MTYILPWQYPTTVVVLDDNRFFLESVEFVMPIGNRFVYGTDHRKVMTFLAETKNIDLNSSGAIWKENGVSQMLLNSKRSHEVSTIVVDYHMPAMNGLEFCENLKEYPCQKILLTANSDESIAIKAFNKGLINGYICKQDPNLETHLAEAISNSTSTYFKNKFIHNFSLDERETAPFMKKDIQSFLKDYLEQNSITEHYMIDQNGSSICVKNNGKLSRISIQNEDELKIPLSWVESENLPLEITQEIKSCSKMLYLSIDELHSLPVSDWKNFLANASSIKKESNFFNAVVENPRLCYSSADISPFFIDDL